MKISTRMSILTGIMLAVSVTVTSVLTLVVVHGELSSQAVQMQESRLKTFWALSAEKGKAFKVADGKLCIDDYVVNDQFELPDRLKEICGGSATIFLGDTRVSTNVMNPDGSTTKVSAGYSETWTNGTQWYQTNIPNSNPNGVLAGNWSPTTKVHGNGTPM